jgi:hypothetical protein
MTSLGRSVSRFERLRVRPSGELAEDGNPVPHRRRHAVTPCRSRPDGSASTCEPPLRRGTQASLHVVRAHADQVTSGGGIASWVLK